MDTKCELNPFLLAPCAIFQISDQKVTWWRKYLHRISKWGETFPYSQVSQIIILHPNSVHFIELCEHKSNSWFLSNFSVCEEVHFILLHYGSKYSQAFSYPYDLSPQDFGSIKLVICPEDFSQVSGQNW